MNNPDTDMNARLERLESYLALDGDNPVLLGEVATLQYQLGLLSAAKTNAEKLLQIDPQRASAHALLGLLASRAAEFSSAIAFLDRAIALGDTAPILQYQLADALVREGQPEAALTHAQRAAESIPALPFAPALYVRVLHCLGRLEDAIEYANNLQQAGLADNCSASFHGAVALIYLDRDDLENARRAASDALQKDPLDVDGNTTFGMTALANGEREQALESFSRAIQQRPHNGRSWLGIGLAQMATGSFNEAAESLQRAADHLQNHLGTLNALAWVHIVNKDAGRAEKVLLAALEIDRNFAETHGALAVVSLMKGHLDSAMQAVKRANGLDRANFAGNFANSLIQQISGNPAQAQAIMEKLLTTPITPDKSTLQHAIVNALAKMR